MLFRGIDGDGDWRFGQGLQDYFFGDQAIAANIATNLRFFLNDFFAAMDKGIDWWNLLGSKNPGATNNILLQTRQTIINCYGVVKINSVNAFFDPNSRRLTLSYSIQSIYSPQVVGQIQNPAA